MRDVAGKRCRSASVNTVGRSTMPCTRSRYASGSTAGMPAWWRSKWRSAGVMVPWRSWSGVREARPKRASRRIVTWGERSPRPLAGAPGTPVVSRPLRLRAPPRRRKRRGAERTRRAGQQVPTADSLRHGALPRPAARPPPERGRPNDAPMFAAPRLRRAHRAQRIDDLARFREALLGVLREDGPTVHDHVEDPVGALDELGFDTERLLDLGRQTGRPSAGTFNACSR